RDVQLVLELIERLTTDFRGARNRVGQILMKARKETFRQIRCSLFQRDRLENPPQLVQFANVLGRQGWRIPSRAVVLLDDPTLLQTADYVASHSSAHAEIAGELGLVYAPGCKGNAGD